MNFGMLLAVGFGISVCWFVLLLILGEVAGMISEARSQRRYRRYMAHRARQRMLEAEAIAEWHNAGL